ncbi:MAG: hypothetical protein HeimC3_43510 [Candidatus Heimdallarchaeota archaeon LC_3]|nr:MAG: hypothetical protein HeimC3_43510 [Candidatus Heimdallarchaeota archaeon LC_3]
MSIKISNWVQDSINSLIYLLILEIIIKKPVYGYLIQNEIENNIQKIFSSYTLSFSSLYTILRKLETKLGLIKTIDCPESQDVREKARRCYEVTKKGVQTYQSSWEDWKKFMKLLKTLDIE